MLGVLQLYRITNIIDSTLEYEIVMISNHAGKINIKHDSFTKSSDILNLIDEVNGIISTLEIDSDEGTRSLGQAQISQLI